MENLRDTPYIIASREKTFTEMEPELRVQFVSGSNGNFDLEDQGGRNRPAVVDDDQIGIQATQTQDIAEILHLVTYECFKAFEKTSML